MFGRLDYARLYEVMASADAMFLLMVPIALVAAIEKCGYKVRSTA